MVCTANITRSPYVAALLRRTLEQSGIRFHRKVVVESAGVNANPNMPALPTISTIAHTRGLNLHEHRSRILTPEMIRDATLILTMEKNHKERILQRHPEMADRVFVLTEFGKLRSEHEGGDVIDPTGRDLAEFQEFIATAEAEVARVAMHIIRTGYLE